MRRGASEAIDLLARIEDADIERRIGWGRRRPVDRANADAIAVQEPSGPAVGVVGKDVSSDPIVTIGPAEAALIATPDSANRVVAEVRYRDAELNRTELVGAGAVRHEAEVVKAWR
jgi:hypothetical protein